MKVKRLLGTLLWVGVAFVTTRCVESDSFYSNVLRNDVYYQLYENHDYDFLWVLDSSGSMSDRRAYIRDNMQNFINTLSSRKAVNFQMAVTDLDMFTTQAKLIQNNSGQDVVSSLTSTNPVADMAGIFNNITNGPTSFWEQGLESMYQAIAQHGSKFMRKGVPLIVILVSDSDDWSCADKCFGVEPEHNPTWVPFPVKRYVDYLKNIKAAENSTVNFFPIVGVPNRDCAVEFEGTRYEEVVSQLGNLSKAGNVCSDALPSSLDDIAHTLADRGIRFPLSSVSSGVGINVFVDGKAVPYSQDNGFVYEASTNSIVFTGNAVPSNGSIIEVGYSQKVN